MVGEALQFVDHSEEDEDEPPCKETGTLKSIISHAECCV